MQPIHAQMGKVKTQTFVNIINFLHLHLCISIYRYNT